jgi:hypothetical protein
MPKKEPEDMNELLILKDAAAELGLAPSYLRLRIGEGRLIATKLGGRDWFVRRADLRAFDESRRQVGRPVDDQRKETAEERRLREYNREQKRKYRQRKQSSQ